VPPGDLPLLFGELAENHGLCLVGSLVLELLAGLVADGVAEVETGHGYGLLFITVRELAGEKKEEPSIHTMCSRIMRVDTLGSQMDSLKLLFF